MLDENHYCLIVGNPGIGKTTLAEMLLLYYVQEDFEVFKVSENIDEMYEVLDKNKKQVFYYDDFLGQIVLNTNLAKNEDRRLVQLLRNIKSYSNTRLILTTREYVLNQAVEKYEPFHLNPNIVRYALNLSDYTPLIRARIFYNHLYFSDLSKEYIRQFAKKESYEKVIYHRNYNPRIIEYMTSQTNAERYPPHNFVAKFVSNLDKPMKIWEFAFKRHLSGSAQHLLLILITQSHPKTIQRCQEAFDVFHKYRAKKYHKDISPYAFRNAMKELDGDLVVISSSKYWGQIISYRNPSVSDFVLEYLLENLDDVKDLLGSVRFYEQLRLLKKFIFDKVQPESQKVHIEYCFLQAINRLLDKNNSSHNEQPEKIFFESLQYRGKNHSDRKLIEYEIKLKFSQYLELNLTSETAYKFDWQALTKIVSYFKSNTAEAGIELVNSIISVFNELVKDLEDVLLSDVDAFNPYIDFLDHATKEQLEIIKSNFEGVCDYELDHLLEIARDGEDVEQDIADVCEKAEALGSLEIQNDYRVDEILSMESNSDEYEYDDHREILSEGDSHNESDVIHAMFSSLGTP